MNKRQLSRVISLYRDGVSPEVCSSNIIEMSRSNTEAGIFISKFFKDVWVKSLNDEIIDLRRKICDLEGGIRSGEYAIVSSDDLEKKAETY